jgi:hypothetical protein
MAQPQAIRQSFDPWFLAAIMVGGFLAGVLVLLATHLLYPRREFKPVGDHAMIQCDRWTGRCQRIEWSADGKLLLGDVYTAP